MPLETDIFISYAHIDDAALIEGKPGWVSEFHRSLKTRLGQLLGYEPKIWRDPKLQGNDIFADEIEDQIPKVALLISILSPRYIKSEWCLREVDKFCEVHQDTGVRSQNKSRIFKIVKTPLEIQDHPDVMRDLLGYDFYKIDLESGKPREFYRFFGEDIEQEYWAKLDDLAYDIADILKKIRPDDNKDESTPQIEGSHKPKVFLAETTSELSDFKDNIRRELFDHGYEVYPDQSLPFTYEELEPKIVSYLEHCELSVHLIGSSYGMIPEGSSKSIIEIQNDLSNEKTKDSKIEKLVWIDQNKKAKDDRQKQFLDSLTNQPENQVNTDLLTTDLEELKSSIHRKLKRIEKRKEAEPASEETLYEEEGAKTIYLIYDQKDLESIGDLDDFLVQKG